MRKQLKTWYHMHKEFNLFQDHNGLWISKGWRFGINEWMREAFGNTIELSGERDDESYRGWWRQETWIWRKDWFVEYETNLIPEELFRV